MAIPIQQKTTVQEFEEFVFLPENLDQHFEFIGGQIVKMVSNNFSSEVAARILVLLGAYVLQNNLGRVLGADGGYIIGEDRYIPDVSFISSERQPKSSHEAYNPNPPDLAVEVMSPTDTQTALRIKIGNYLANDVLVWVVRPDDKIVEVYESGKAVKLLYEDDALNSGTVLAGFEVKVRGVGNRADMIYLTNDKMSALPK